MDALKDGKMVCEECSHMNSYCTLFKSGEPNFIKTSREVKFVEWNENKSYKNDYNNPALNLSLVMSPFNDFYTWMTTIIDEIIEEREGYVKFKTTNSEYELYYTEIYKPNGEQ
jgi:hypothetical protein